MGKEVEKQEKRSRESPVSTGSVILERIHPLGDGRLVGQKVAKGGRCAGGAPQKEAVELPLANPRGPEER